MLPSSVNALPIIGESPDNPILPAFVDPTTGKLSFAFSVGGDGLGVDRPIYIDPPFDFLFVDLVPDPLPDPFTLLEATSIVIPLGNHDGDEVYLIRVFEAGEIEPSQEFEIAIGPSVFFSIPAVGIEIEDLDPGGLVADDNGKNGFVFGLTFVQAGDVALTITPKFIPAPATIMLLLFGFCLMYTRNTINGVRLHQRGSHTSQ